MLVSQQLVLLSPFLPALEFVPVMYYIPMETVLDCSGINVV